MGAEFQITTIKHTERKQAAEAFDRLQDQDRYENGHSYSGGFGMAQGLEFRDDMAFPSEDAAYDWLCDNTHKWEAAIAVRLVTDSGHEGYIVGATCSS